MGIAAALRGYLARADARRGHQRKKGAALFIARAWRWYVYRRNQAAVSFQAVARGARARRTYKELLAAISRAIVVQSVVSGFNTRRKGWEGRRRAGKWLGVSGRESWNVRRPMHDNSHGWQYL